MSPGLELGNEEEWSRSGEDLGGVNFGMSAHMLERAS